MSEEPEVPEQKAEPEQLARPGVPELDAILGKPFKVLDDGFIRVVDYMGSDKSIVQAARVSYGEGTKQVSQDGGLIRYLMRHHHTTPFEMCELKLHVRVPMDCWRQWIRHRTACLAEGTELYFDLPGGIKRRGNQLYKLPIEEVWQRFQPTCNSQRPDKQKNPLFKRQRVKDMRLRQVNENTLRIQHTRIVDVYKNGVKPVFRLTLSDGKKIEATRDHRFFFSDGWHTLAEATGLHESNGHAVWDRNEYTLFVNGHEIQVPMTYRGSEWLHERYNKLRQEQLGDIVIVAKPVRIKEFEFVGYKETYDIEVEGPFHNFIANGIVTHNSVNEYSTRYSLAIDAAQMTEPDQWRLQSSGNRQGSDGRLAPETGEVFTQKERDLLRVSRERYEERIEAGIAREQARKDLPLSTYTEAYWKTNLHNLFHFLRLRMDEHAQWEIRQYALTIGHEMVQRWCPIAWQAFLDYSVESMSLTRLDWQIIGAIQSGDSQKAIELAIKFRFLSEDGTPRRNRERNELEAKLRQLSIAIPWSE